MIVNMIFHGAWVFVISEKWQQILAYSPDESIDHKYGVGSVSKNTLAELPSGDYEFGQVARGTSVWYPNNEYTPLISAKRQGTKRADPTKKRYCRIAMPIPKPVNIFPLEPYNTVSFLKGKAASEVKDLKQFASVHCFVYECSSLNDLKFVSKDNTVIPDIPTNPSPYQGTANLHVFATYWDDKSNKEDDVAQMQRCFEDMTNLLDPKLDLQLQINTSVKISPLDYPLPPGVTKREVELSKDGSLGILWGPGRNCQNANFFLNETDEMQLP
jgi:hypothetical protein